MILDDSRTSPDYRVNCKNMSIKTEIAMALGLSFPKFYRAAEARMTSRLAAQKIIEANSRNRKLIDAMV